MTTNKYPRGSEWRKWDLHVHTPASDGTGTPEEIVNKAIEQGLSVIAITDHHSVDYIDQVKAVAKDKDLSVISGIEFRSEYGSKSVHFIAYFPDEYENTNLDSAALKDLILAPLDLSRTKIVAKGKDQNSSLSDDSAFKKGMFLVQVDFKAAADLIHKYGGIISVHNGSKENGLDKEVKHLGKAPKNAHSLYECLGTLKEELMKEYVDICDIEKEGDDEEFYLNTFFKPSILTSDAHRFEDIGSRYTWIKADPTFEGLKQILYEPESRVRIQEDNPEFEREKCPFTSIYIPNETKVFSDDDDIKFASTNLPLNNSLVSIIGGRGTGKSQLINYLASAFNRNNNPGKYNLCSDITIGRKASLTEESKEFKVSDEPNAPFMYIAQSQIKELVENKEKLSRNVLETIGVSDEYKKTTDYSQGIDESINEYDRIVKVLNVDGKSLEERKEDIQKEIKRYSDFIQNITSEQNKKKLEDYKTKVERLHIIENWQIKVRDQYEKNEAFITELNESIKIWNEKLGASVPLADIQATQKYIIEVLLPKLATLHQETKSSIENTKNEFKEYKGDLSALLSNVSLYQTKVSELNKEKETVEQEGVRYNTIATESFKKHGEAIKKSIENYTSLIKKTWKSFKGETEATESYKKDLLDVILKDGMEVEATITFDKDKMYDLLLNGLDGRSFNLEKLQQILSIATIDDFYNFVCQTGTINAFSSVIREDLRRRILIVFFKEYTKFISIGVKVTLNNKPITKLSYGQQGTIYLRLQLAANLFSETIIYDQPEDDLDNEFISDELISIFKTLKKYRQIIIVSHNANLVVNSDSEQVIVAKNTDGLLSYSSGALEDPFINSEVCRVLEGGKKAFEDRERKYRLS